MEYVLKTDKLNKRYKKFKALNQISLSVPKGSIYGFVGRNGAGKTTLIRVICGLNLPTNGNYSLFGVDYKDPKIADSRKKLGAVVETPSIYLNLTAKENLKMQCRVLGKDFSCIDGLLELVGLKDTGKKLAKDFSLGMRQRLGIAFSLVSDPEFLILDEPINGLDPQGIIEVREMLIKLNREKGITILISSHILDELAKLATHYGFIEGGRIIKEMSAEELEEACRKVTTITVDDIGVLEGYLKETGADYKIISDKEAEVYSHVVVTPLVLALSERKCIVEKINERHESLESYFIGLVGGASNE